MPTTHPGARRHDPVRRAELIAWGVAACLVGLFAAAFDMPAREAESGLLVFLIAGFWLALPGRATSALVAIACGLGPLLAHYVTTQLAHSVPAATLPGIAAAALGAVTGRLAGGRLDVHAGFAPDEPIDRAQALSLGGREGRGPWYARALDVRTLLAAALSALTAIGLVPVFRSVHGGPGGDWPVGMAQVRWWQAVTFVGWVLLAPTLLRLRRRRRSPAPATGEVPDGLTPVDALAHGGVVLCLTVLHAIVLATITRLVLRGNPAVADDAFAHVLTITRAYLPFDLLTYTAVLGLAYLADRERLAGEARQRAAALQAAALHARLAAVRARLNPHFLYNALNAAIMLAREERGAETSAVLEDLAGLLRYVLNDQDGSVPLEREIDFVRRYLEIQRVRFGPRLQFSIAVDAAVALTPVPPLLLQPLVENAVEHGVAAAPHAGTVTVTARREGDVLLLAVDDDGPGVSAPAADSHTPIVWGGAGIGLGHTRERLAALFGPAATVTLTPCTPSGTRAEVRVPLAVPRPE